MKNFDLYFITKDERLEIFERDKQTFLYLKKTSQYLMKNCRIFKMWVVILPTSLSNLLSQSKWPTINKSSITQF